MVDKFKCSGSFVRENGGTSEDVTGRLGFQQDEGEGYDGSPVSCLRFQLKVKEKSDKIVVWPAMVYGSEFWALNENDETKL